MKPIWQALWRHISPKKTSARAQNPGSSLYGQNLHFFSLHLFGSLSFPKSKLLNTIYACEFVKIILNQCNVALQHTVWELLDCFTSKQGNSLRSDTHFVKIPIWKLAFRAVLLYVYDVRAHVLRFGKKIFANVPNLADLAYFLPR